MCPTLKENVDLIIKIGVNFLTLHAPIALVNVLSFIIY